MVKPMLVAALIGLGVGLGSMASMRQHASVLVAAARNVGAAAGLVRARSPQVGDSWRGCDDARAVGTAPIYQGEPGFRKDMDGDDDGIACEPHP
jgi:hypothetical protein